MTLPENHIARRLKIQGKVQGVGYRDWMVREAQKFGLFGWVRNRKDGSVEALLVGEIDQVKQMIDRAYEGSLYSSVNEIYIEEAVGVTAHDFRRLPTV